MTFLFTDIEGSTRRWERYGEAMGRCVARHDELLGRAVTEAGGVVVKHTGDGMLAAFAHADAALAAAIEGQRSLAAQDWSPVPALRVRMGIHQGRAEPLGADYFGVTVNRAARVADAGHGGQVLVSAAAVATLNLPPRVQLLPRGAHQLKDLAEPVELCQVLAPGLDTEPLPLRTLDPAKARLPVQRSAFFGRTAQLREALRCLDDGRLLTLCGPGGVGKTRLAVQVAAEVAGVRADGARFVDLSGARPGQSLERLVCDQLGISAGTAPSPVVAGPAGGAREALARHLARQELLVVVDNCEQVAEAAADLAGWCIDALPGVQLLCTSREPLRIAGEQVIRVEPFELDATARSGVTDPAVELFLDRARASGARTPELDQLATVATICDLVDRLPLGIELAAARTGTMALGELARRIAEHHGVLSSRERDRTRRHRTIDELLHWSFTLLNPAEQRLLAGLGVFAGPVGLDAIELVCSPQGHQTDRAGADTVDLLSSLVERSLVVHDGQAGRYRLLGLVRRFARQQLEGSDEEAAQRARYWRWCASLGDQLEDDERLRAVAAGSFHEVANALDDAVHAGDLAATWAIASWFWRIYEMTGRVEDGIAVLERAHRLGPIHPNGSDHTQRYAHAQWYARGCNGLAGLLVAMGEADRAIALHDEAAEVSAAVGDAAGIGWASIGRSMAVLRREPVDLDGAAACAETAITQFAGTSERRGRGHAHSALGLVAARRQRLDEAEAHYLAALSELRLGRHRRDAAAVLTNLGNLAHDRSEFLRATRFFDGARQLSIELGDLRSTAFIVNNLALVAHGRGDLDHAARFCREALELFERVEDSQGAAVAWLHLANLHAEGDQRAAALHAYREAIEAFRLAGDARGVLTGLTNLSRVAWGWEARGLAWRCEADRAVVAHRLGLPRTLADAVTTLAERAVELGNGELAARLRRALDETDAATSSPPLASILLEARLSGPSDPLSEGASSARHDPDADADPDVETESADGAARGVGRTAGSAANPLEGLTERERELLRLLGEGRTNEELAAALYISRRTVDAHLSHIRTKLGVSDRVKLAVLARRHLGEAAEPR